MPLPSRAAAFGVHIGTTGDALHGLIGGATFASTWRTLACLPRSSSIIIIHAIALAFLLTVGTVLAAFT